uniref:hypothetical protein n=1 Tax=Phascolarctobacterium succinatutens TaxID=626940 RepID=UPI003AF04707
ASSSIFTIKGDFFSLKDKYFLLQSYLENLLYHISLMISAFFFVFRRLDKEMAHFCFAILVAGNGV